MLEINCQNLLDLVYHLQQNLAFKKAINISKPNDVTEIKAAADNCNEEIHMVEPVNDLVG